MKKTILKEGQKFGMLTIIGEGYYKNGRWGYDCLCECGRKTFTKAFEFKNGTKWSCGCYSGKLRKKNNYDVNGETVIVHLTNTDAEMLCDLDDWEKQKYKTWYINNMGYAISSIKNHHVVFHEVIMCAEKGMVVDHINRNKLDNRKSNLRIVTQHVNKINSSVYCTNTSGHTGVTYRKDTKKWMAQIVYNYKHISLGCYEKKEDAIRAREIAEEKYFHPLLEVR